MIEIPEDSNPSLSNKTPHIPPRPEKPSLFLSEYHRTERKMSKFLNSNNKSPLAIGKSSATLFRSFNIDKTADLKTEEKHLVKKFAIPETTVEKTPDCFALNDTTVSVVYNLKVNHQQLKTDNESIQSLSFRSTQNKFQNNFPQEKLSNQFQSKTY